MVALESTNYIVLLFVNLNIPEPQKSHPFMTDILIEDLSSSNTAPTTVTVASDSRIVVVIEVKKAINSDFMLVEPKTVIKTLIYVHYIMALHYRYFNLCSLHHDFTWSTHIVWNNHRWLLLALHTICFKY